MRVGLFSPNYPGISGDGGIGTYTRVLASALVQSGHNVEAVTLGPSSRRIVADGVPVSVVTHSYAPIMDRLLPGATAARSVGKTTLKLVHDHSLDLFEFPNWEGLGVWFALRRKVPLVVRLSTSSAETQQIDGLPQSWRLRSEVAREKLQGRLADGLITHSAAHRRLMAKELGIDEARITVIPLGVEVFPDFVRPAISNPAPKVVFLGRLEKRKGAFELLNAIPLVLKEFPGANFILIGPDRRHCPGGRTHLQYVQNEFSPEIRSHITFAGSLPNPEVAAHLQTADVFVAPSLYESFGLIFLEAMRWGTPVIGTYAGGIPEIVEHDRSGVLVQPSNHQELAAAIASLLRDPQRRKAIGEAGRARAERHFSVKAMTDRTLDVYGDVLQRSSGTRAR